MEEDWAQKVANFQMGVAIVTAWLEQDTANVGLIDDLVRSYAAEEGADRVIAGLISLAGNLVGERFSRLTRRRRSKELVPCFARPITGSLLFSRPHRREVSSHPYLRRFVRM
jgi:hypothetical protein